MFDILQNIAAKIDEEVSFIEKDLGKGSAKDYAHYREACGNIKGLIRAKTYMVDAYNDQIREEDNDDE